MLSIQNELKSKYKHELYYQSVISRNIVILKNFRKIFYGLM